MKLPIKIFLPIIVIFHTIIWYIAFFVLKQNDIFGLYQNGFFNFVLVRQGEYYGSLMMVLMAFNILLATRARFLEKIFSGLDKVYVAHKYTGYLIFLLLLLHFFLVKGGNVPTGFFKYSVSIANPLFYTFLASIFISALPNIPVIKKVLNMPYHIWKYTHYLMGIIFVVGTYHSVGASSFVFSNTILMSYMFLIYWIGFAALIYKSFLYRLLKRRYKYKIIERASYNGGKDIISFKLAPLKENKKIVWKAGQFALFKFIKNGLKEIHPFTISNAVNEDGIVRISIKNLGDWTQKIGLEKGVWVDTKVIIDGPYGNFVSKKENNNQEIWIAGGIGVTPFLAMLEDYKKENTKNNNSNKQIIFIWSVKDKSEAVFEEEILKDLPNNIHFILHDTSEKGFFKFENYKDKIKKDLALYICGPEAMRESIIKDAKNLEVNKINFEEFKFR